MLTDEELSALRQAAQILGEDYEVRAIDLLIKRVEELEGALILITQTAPFGRPQEIAREVLRLKRAYSD